MDELIRFNEVMLFLYSKKDGRPFVMKEEIPRSSNGVNITERVLMQLYDDGFIHIKEEHAFGGGISKTYALNLKGIILCSTLPDEFSRNPYGYYLKKIEEEKIKQGKKDKLQDDLNASAIRTNYFVVLTFISITAGVIYQALTYRLDKSREPEPSQVKEIDSLKKQQLLLRDSIHHLMIRASTSSGKDTSLPKSKK